MKTLAALALSLAFAASAFGATAIAEGKGRFDFVDAKGRPDRPIPVFTYRPASCDAKCPIQFVMAGMHRNASSYRDYWMDAAEKYRLIIVAPEFSAKQWPKAAAYNLGDVAVQDDREKWSYSAIEHLFDEIRDGRGDYRIFGHSAGGQFVQRMAFFLPGNRASVIAAANPGWYAMPEWRKDRGADPYPYSLVASKVGEAEVKRALGRPFVLLLGEKDVAADAENLNVSDEAKRQGAGRLERGENFFRAANAASRDLGAKFAWQLVRVPDVAHSGPAMSRFAADTLYGPR
jgi:pimeloyl-ACP methyl ester carboxylesterase